MIPKNKKFCPFCSQIKFKSQFSKRKYTDDGLSPCCKDCIKIYKKWFLWNFNDVEKNDLIVNYLKKQNKDIKISGVDVDKIQKIRIKVKDVPGIVTPILKTLPEFLLLYDLSLDEFYFIISKFHQNKFYFI